MWLQELESSLRLLCYRTWWWHRKPSNDSHTVWSEQFTTKNVLTQKNTFPEDKNISQLCMKKHSRLFHDRYKGCQKGWEDIEHLICNLKNFVLYINVSLDNSHSFPTIGFSFPNGALSTKGCLPWMISPLHKITIPVGENNRFFAVRIPFGSFLEEHHIFTSKNRKMLSPVMNQTMR